MRLYKLIKLFENDYKGEHSAPDPETGSPLHNLTLNKTYPEDVYSSNGPRYYGDGTHLDHESFSIVNQLRNKPHGRIKIYRAVPKIMSKDEKINDLENQKKHILKHGKIPSHINTTMKRDEYYSHISDEIDKLKSSSDEDIPKMNINKGDWVSINKNYVKDHGESLHGKGNYRILSKTVPAKHLYTNGDSIHEWGYHPD